MSDIHALSGAYAVDALDDAERAEFERHLAECPTCRSEVDSLREAAALLAETTATEPSRELRDRILIDIDTVRPLPPEVPQPSQNVTELAPRRRRRLTGLLAAAAAVIAVGAGGVVWQQVDESPSRIDQVIEASDAQEFKQTLPGGGTATVVRSEKENGAVLITHDMPAAPSDHEYALWLQHDEAMVPAGIMPSGADNEVLLEGDAATADGAGITVEVAGENPAEPSDDVVALFSFAT
jgi:anti-sigma-K factor RskA